MRALHLSSRLVNSLAPSAGAWTGRRLIWAPPQPWPPTPRPRPRLTACGRGADKGPARPARLVGLRRNSTRSGLPPPRPPHPRLPPRAAPPTMEEEETLLELYLDPCAAPVSQGPRARPQGLSRLSHNPSPPGAVVLFIPAFQLKSRSFQR